PTASRWRNFPIRPARRCATMLRSWPTCARCSTSTTESTSHTMLRITLAQLNPTVGDIEGNTQRMAAAARQAAGEGAQLIVFGELAVTGFQPGDLLAEPGFMDRVDAALALLQRESAALP